METRREEVRPLAALVLAGALHLALAAALVVRTPAAPPSALRPALAADELVVDIETPEAPQPLAGAVSLANVRGIGAGAEARASISRTPRGPADAPETATEATAPTAPGAVVAHDSDGWTFHAEKLDLGIDGNGHAGAVARESAREAANDGLQGRASQTGGLAESLDARDVSLGLGRGGFVRSAVESAVQTSSVMGNATFEVSIDSSGRVLVGLANASSDASGWAALADAIRAGVTARRDQLRLPPGARGLRVAVRAEAKEQFPDGRTPQMMGSSVSGTPGSITETKDKITIKLPSVTVAHVGKVCAEGLHVGLDGIGILGGCSPENAGAPAARIVATRIVGESRM